MWITFDVGNSRIKGGLFEGETLIETFTLSHEDLKADLDALLSGRDVGLERAGLASVVPRSADLLARILRDRGLSVTRIRHDIHLPFELAYTTPETLGHDRIALSAAAWVLHGQDRAVVALDGGTAFTYEVIDRTGVYRGGTIAPGPALMARALNHDTAQLPEVPLELPATPIGRSTQEAMQVGIMWGFVESVRGLLRRINEALAENAYVVATGGWSDLLEKNVSEVDERDAHLVLRGVRILMELNPPED